MRSLGVPCQYLIRSRLFRQPLHQRQQRDLRLGVRPHPSKQGDPLVSFPLALLASSLALTVHSDASPHQNDPLTPLSRIELNTGVLFPMSLPSDQHLSGVGARFMGGLVKVYAVGIYLDQAAARSALADWIGFTADDIIASDPLWNTLCSVDAGISRTVRMVVVKEVNGKHMQNGFERALLGRVASFSKTGRCRPKESKALAKRFCALFATVGTMKVGSDIRITVDGDLITLVIDGRFIGKLQNAQLSQALLDMFVGDKAVVHGLREEVAKGLELMLQEE